MNKTMTPKQLAANRRNATKSTGPKTPEGRAASKLNALKHGILSQEVLVRGRVLRESARELAALHQRFRDDLQPVGPVEEMLVDQIVTAHWRRRRALTAEAGEIALSVDGGQWERNRGPDSMALWLRWGATTGDPVPRMEESSFGLRLVENKVRELRRQVEQPGGLTEAIVEAGKFCGHPNHLSRDLEKLRLELERDTEGLEPEALRARNRERAVRLLDQKLSMLEWQQARCEEREAKEEAAKQAAAVLPSMETLEKIARYETKLERQLHRAMLQLERLQRRRQGEAVPVPMAVELSGRD